MTDPQSWEVTAAGRPVARSRLAPPDHEAIRNLGVPVGLTFLDDDDAAAATLVGRVLYQAD